MRKIALLHTVLPVAASFEGELRAALAVEVKVYNVWDQFLSLDPNDVGVFTRISGGCCMTSSAAPRRARSSSS